MQQSTLLAVEDNEDDVFALKWSLKKAGIENPLQIVTDGQQAVDYLSGVGGFADREAYPLPALVLLDLKLPYLSGFEVLDWIRRQPSLHALPVVVLSGSDEHRDHDQANTLGVVGYLVKPPSPEALSAVIESKIERSTWP